MKTEDIRITQYALGELSGSDREAFEKEMAADPELLEEVRRTQQFCEMIPANPEPEAAFIEAERVDLLKRIEAERKEAAERKTASIWPRLWVYGGIAAGVVVLANLSIPAVTGALSKRSAVPGKLDSMAVNPTGLVASVTPVPAVREQEQTIPEVLEAPVSASLALADEDKSAVSVLGGASQGGQLFKAEGARALAEPAGPAASAPMANPPVEVAAAVLVAAPRGRADEVAQTQVKAFTGGWGKGSGAGTGVKAKDGRFTDADGTRYRQPSDAFNTEGYDYQEENRFLGARENPLSTFSIDVDTASYSNIRRFLQQQNQLPPKGAVRTEELINYFPYTYPQPEGADPFSVNVEVSKAPWNPQHELVRIGLKGRELAAEKRPASNLVFLIDVSGSMSEPNKLPLLQKSLLELTSRLAAKDRVAIVVYAGSSGLVLPSTADKSAIRDALDRLQAGGSTNGAEGIKLAYREARENFLEEGNNRVILCTDGDFNVGVTSEQSLVDLIEKERKSGVFLSVLGFGTGNLKDSQMEKLADKGNGNYAYIDSISEGRKVLGEQMGGTLFTIAKDVKIQVEFNPATVAGYRLIGYENRLLAKEDFNNDKKDAGEIGAGHTVTAFYEVVPAGQPLPDADSVDALKYQSVPAENSKPAIHHSQSGDLLTVKLRYKQPDGETSKLLEVPVANAVKEWSAASEDFRFGAAVAAFGQKLRGSKAMKDFDWAAIQKLARPNLGDDQGSYRAEFLTLLEKARQIDENR